MNSKVKNIILGKEDLLELRIPYNLTLTEKYGRGEENTKNQKGIQLDYCKTATFNPMTQDNLRNINLSKKFNKNILFKYERYIFKQSNSP